MNLFKKNTITLILIAVYICNFNLFGTNKTSTTPQKAIAQQKNPKEVWMTIFIHGIINIKPHLSFSNLIRFMRDQITDSIYARAVEIMRKDPFFYQVYAIQGLGLQPIDMSQQNPGNATTAFAHAYKEFASLHSSNQEQLFYTFGWSGLLSSQVRYQEALIFYDQLDKEITRLRAKGLEPKIQTVAYSHGGYVALKTADAADQNLLHANIDTNSSASTPPSFPWYIDELILIGVPVIPDSDFLVQHPLFKKIFHFYSPADRVQVVDCLATNRFFSNRVFSSRYGFTLPDTLTQIQLRFKRIARTATKQCDKHTNGIPARLLRNADPGHTELWSFGWTFGYRDYLPYHPFPVGAYLGYLVAILRELCLPSNHLVMDVRLFENKMLIKSINTSPKLTIPFPGVDDHQRILSIIKPCIPVEYTRDMYEQKAKQALAKAHAIKKAEKKEKWLKRRKWRRTKI